MVRVRFAPSPTGFLHIGGARTALFNWLYARRQKGKFFLRIEDTDRVRSKKEYLDEILDSLKWLGFDWDGEPYFQTRNLESYRKYARDLLDKDKAYTEPNPEGEGEAIKFKLPSGKVHFFDLIHDRIEVDLEVLQDQVLIKSDGYPAYNFACVIDDANMEITHVIRGDDHISNTPKQLVLYEALGIRPPKYAHIPLIMAEGGGKLSKRTGADRVTSLREEGYLPEAVVNYLALLGWSPGNDREMFTLSELVDNFSLKRINKTAAAFNSDKLDWMNGQYIMKLGPDKLKDMVLPQLKGKGYSMDDGRLLKLVTLYQPRIKKISDFLPATECFFTDDFLIDEDAGDLLREKGKSARLSEFSERLAALDPFNETNIEKCLRSFAEEIGIKAAGVIHPVRAALTGQTRGAGLFEIMIVLGKDRCVTRIKKSA